MRIAGRALKIKGNEVEVVVSVQRVTVKLHVAFHLQVLSGVEGGPRRSGQAHAANVEITEPSAVLIEDVIDPGKLALAGARVALANKPIRSDSLGNPSTFITTTRFTCAKATAGTSSNKLTIASRQRIRILRVTTERRRAQ